MKNHIDRVVSRPDSTEAVRADMSLIKNNPYNFAASNITSMYGGYVTKENWKASSNRSLKPPTAKTKSSELWTSCDEAHDVNHLLQRYDDDKLELTCYEHWWNIILA